MADHPPEGDGLGEPDAWEWCPACESYHPSDAPCDHGDDWGPDDLVGLGPEPWPDDPPDWYRALAPHHPWRD